MLNSHNISNILNQPEKVSPNEANYEEKSSMSKPSIRRA